MTGDTLRPRPIRAKRRVAYLVSHPIQYQAPLLRLLSAQSDIDLTVFFQSDLSTQMYHDPGFDRPIEWDIPLLDGYRHEFLPALGSRESVAGIRPYSYGILGRLWRGGFDVLWIHGYARWFNWEAILAAKMAGIRVLVRDEATSISASRSRVKTLLKRLFFKVLGGMCDGFLSIGSLNREYYLRNGIDPGRIYSVPYCVDNDRFAGLARAAAPKREQFRARLGLAAGRPIILYAAKFQRRKRAADLLAAFQKLIAAKSGDERPYLLFVGDGEMRADLEAQARSMPDVRFLGFRNQSELPAFFDLCDVFVLPSESEPWGLIVNEVMNAGRAIIASNQVGCGPDLVRDGVNGYVYPVGDIDALAKALAAVLDDRDKVVQMGRASAEIIGRWNFERDIDGIRSAIDAVMRAY
jgi:glycosyltransferase involved in cell wall biosynthesis